MTDQAPAPISPPAPRPPAIIAGGQVAAIVPQNIEEAFRVSDAFYKSGLAPSSLKSAPAVLVAVMAGAELGFAPFQSMQSIAVINGKAAMWGDAIPALLWSSGFTLKEWIEGEGDSRVAYCTVTRPTGEEITRTFSVADAKEAGLWGKAGPWQQYRGRMLQMRARAFAARDGASDVLKGLPVYEEVRDYQGDLGGGGGQGQGSGLRARLKSGAQTGEGFTTAQAEHVDNGAHPADVAANAAAVEAEIEDIKEDAEERARAEAEAEAEAEDQAQDGYTERGQFDSHNGDKEGDLDNPCEQCGAAAGEECRADCPGLLDAGEEPTGEKINTAEATAELRNDPHSPENLGDFPGDREPGAPKADPPADPKPSAPSSTFKARIAGCRQRLTDISAPNLTKLKSTWANAAQLISDLDKADPDALAELQAFYDELLVKHEDAAKVAGKAK